MPLVEIIPHTLDDGDFLFPTQGSELPPVGFVRGQPVRNVRVSLRWLLLWHLNALSFVGWVGDGV